MRIVVCPECFSLAYATDLEAHVKVAHRDGAATYPHGMSEYEQGRNDGLEDAAKQVETILRNNDATVIVKIPTILRGMKREKDRAP